jgi:3-deoxy-manno-octulosonate cytidylyltransferase (CMP-KDO synthetase)
MPRTLGVIPARYASTRFPGKPLASLGDKTLIEEVWRRCAGASRLDRLVVATDDERIAGAARGFGADVCMTSADHPSGTDRVAEVVRTIEGGFDVVVNIQGDEPLITATSLDRLVELFDDEPRTEMATLCEPIESPDELYDPNVVKVVVAAKGRALYFSRSPVPYHRGAAAVLDADFRETLGERTGGLDGFFKHQGIYAYRRDVLMALTHSMPSRLEVDEGLEQLRALEAGYVISVVESDFRSRGVDTPADLERVVELLGETS